MATSTNNHPPTNQHNPSDSTVSPTRPRKSAANPDYPRPQKRVGTEQQDASRRTSAVNPDYPRPQKPAGTGGKPGSLTDELEEIVERWATSQYELVVKAAEFADSPEWILTGSPTAAHWLAIVADVQPCTTREWIRIGRLLATLPAIGAAFRDGTISYSKVRTLTRLATPQNETELLDIAHTTTAADLGKALAAWLHRNSDPEDIDAYHHQQRSVKWRTEPDGMVTFSLRLPPLMAALLISFLTTWVMRTRPKPNAQHEWPSLAQQHADALHDLLSNGAGTTTTEVVVHVNGQGNALDDGTPLSDHTVTKLIPESFISALIHDSASNPIDATNRRRHPTRRQQRLVKARDQKCIDCGSRHLLQFDHVPEYEQTGHTITTELELRCAPCHTHRHNSESGPQNRTPHTG